MAITSEYGDGNGINGTYGCLVQVSDGYLSGLYTMLSTEKLRRRLTPENIEHTRKKVLDDLEAAIDERKLPVTNGVTYDVLSGICEVSSFMDWTDPAQVAKLKGVCDGYITAYGMSQEEVDERLESLKNEMDSR